MTRSEVAGLDMSFLEEKFKKALTLLPHMPRAFGLVWASAPRWTVVWLILLTVQGLLPVASVYLTRALVDSLVFSLEGDVNWQSFRPTLGLVLLMGIGVALWRRARRLTYEGFSSGRCSSAHC